MEKHQRELADVSTHQLQVVNGAHYLHWSQAPLLGRSITDFVTANVATTR